MKHEAGRGYNVTMHQVQETFPGGEWYASVKMFKKKPPQIKWYFYVIPRTTNDLGEISRAALMDYVEGVPLTIVWGKVEPDKLKVVPLYQAQSGLIPPEKVEWFT